MMRRAIDDGEQVPRRPSGARAAIALLSPMSIEDYYSVFTSTQRFSIFHSLLAVQ
jgi:hypothetical protein